ncbi:MAG TPA: lysyl oxidase family protein [Vitreimonas sp.]|jgi:hypothetical protein|nr:lysyl oxidase family protein [Vitreimonas sp.]
MSSRARTILITVFVVTVFTASGVAAARPSSGGLLPDIRAVVPTHLQLVNAHQRDVLRFSNGVANTGAGDWRMRPEYPSGNLVQNAVQEILDANGNVVSEKVVSTFEYHPSHNHWHIGDVALFEVRKGSPTGPVATPNLSLKVTFCLIDWYKLDDNSPTKERTYWDCYNSYQGISPGWVDQYHQSTDGQQLDITDIPNANDYYLVSTSNHAKVFIESDYTNNTAWVKFRLYQSSNGNRKIEVLEGSPCDSPGMCGLNSTNR